MITVGFSSDSGSAADVLEGSTIYYWWVQSISGVQQEVRPYVHINCGSAYQSTRLSFF